MKYNIPDLFRKSRNGMLSHDEIHWVEQQVRHLPYFQLHQMLLAQQEYIVDAGNPYIERGLIYSTNKKAMAAQMVQDPDQDLFSPSLENILSSASASTHLPYSDTFVLPTPERTPQIEYSSSEPVPESKSQNPEIENTVEIQQTPESFTDSEVPIHTDDEETPSPTKELSVIEMNDIPVSEDFILKEEATDENEILTTESLAVKEVENPNDIKIRHTNTEHPQTMGINGKLDYKINFRLQMFAWQSVVLRQQIDEYKSKILSSSPASDNSGKSSLADELIASPAVKTLDLPVLPSIEFNGAFEPEFKETETVNKTPKVETIVQENSTSDVLIEKTPEENNLASEIQYLAFRHNDLLLDIIIHPETNRKYLKRSGADLSISPVSKKGQGTQNISESVSGLKKRKKPDRNLTLKIIDRFIEMEPELGINPLMMEGKQEDISRKSAHDDSEIVSETLAEIYLKQGNKQKAIRIYEKLLLKFPEKSSYFESLLRNI